MWRRWRAGHGWLVACGWSHTVEFVGDGVGGDGGGRASLGRAGGGAGSGDGEFNYPASLTVVPDLGLVVRDSEDGNSGRLQVFATPDIIAMAAMSPNRVAWMTAVARGVLRRKGAVLQRGTSDVGLKQAGGSKRARAGARGGAL